MPLLPTLVVDLRSWSVMMNHVAEAGRIVYPIVDFDCCSFGSGRWGKLTASGWVVSRPAGPRFRLPPAAAGDESPLDGRFRAGRGPDTSGRAPCGDGKALLSIENIIRENSKDQIRGRGTGLGVRIRFEGL